MLLQVKIKKYKKITKKLWEETKRRIEVVNDDEPIKYRKDFMKINFESDNDLLLGKTFNIPDMIIVVASALEKNGKYYPQIFLHECTCKLVFQKELTLIKQVHQKNLCFVIIGTLKIMDLNSNLMFLINITMYLWLLIS